MDTSRVLDRLNSALRTEYAAILQYWHHSLLVTGLHSAPIAARLKEIAGDEIAHAELLGERIVALGGRPTCEVGPVQYASDAEGMLRLALAEEEQAAEDYRKILDLVREDETLTHAVYHLIRGEQEHIEELRRLLG